MAESLIRAREISKVYSDQGVPVRALSDVNITIERGEFTAIVGPSGSGKTTLLNILSGLDRPSAGEVYLAGRLISTMSDAELADFRRDHVGFVFQSYNLIPVLTVAENVEYVLVLKGVEMRQRREKVKNILLDLGLAGYEERLPTKLSGGQQQRVAVARAMVSDPDIILADEPTANLDSQTGGELLDLMRRLNEERGMTFIFSTHDEMVMARAKRLVFLKDGRIEGRG